MPESRLVQVSLDGYVAFFAALAISIAILYWHQKKKEKQTRKQFFEQFNRSELRMSPHQVGLVYRVIKTKDTISLVVPIWKGKSQIINGEEKTLDHSHLMPFDETRFF